MEGYIWLHREIQDHWIFKKAEYYRAWSIIILNVNHSKGKVLINHELMNCERGESLKSLSTWVKLFSNDWTIQKVRTFFKLLSNDKMVLISGKKTTRLSVVNYDKYNTVQHATNTLPTRYQHATNTLPTTNNKEKKENNKNKEKKDIKDIADKSAELETSFDTFWNNYGKCKDKKGCLEFWKKKMNNEQRELSIFKAKEQYDNVEMRFRKDPIRWLKKDGWNDVIIKQQVNKPEKRINEATGFDMSKKKGW